MRAFSQLLDDLVYTRSRNSKLRLIGEYLNEKPARIAPDGLSPQGT